VAKHIYGSGLQDDRDDVYDEVGVGNDVLDFLLEFLEARPQFLGRDFFVTGNLITSFSVVDFTIPVI
jgi:hypothetical protein